MPTCGIPTDFRGGVHLFIYTPSGQSRVYRVTQLRTDGGHCRESASPGPGVFKVVPVTGAAFAGITMDQSINVQASPWTSSNMQVSPWTNQVMCRYHHGQINKCTGIIMDQSNNVQASPWTNQLMCRHHHGPIN